MRFSRQPQDMLRSDQLDDERLFDADEVDDEGSHGMLTPEAVTSQAPRPQQPRESVFRIVAANSPGPVREQLRFPCRHASAEPVAAQPAFVVTRCRLDFVGARESPDMFSGAKRQRLDRHGRLAASRGHETAAVAEKQVTARRALR